MDIEINVTEAPEYPIYQAPPVAYVEYVVPTPPVVQYVEVNHIVERSRRPRIVYRNAVDYHCHTVRDAVGFALDISHMARNFAHHHHHHDHVVVEKHRPRRTVTRYR